jgi:hypothetical protein
MMTFGQKKIWYMVFGIVFMKIIFYWNVDFSHPWWLFGLVVIILWHVAVATLLWESVKMRLTFLKWGLGSPLGLPKLQSLISGVKTPRIGAFCISLESYQSVDVENGFTWAIWTFVAQVISKRKAWNQIGSLIPDH